MSNNNIISYVHDSYNEYLRNEREYNDNDDVLNDKIIIKRFKKFKNDDSNIKKGRYYD